MSSPHLAVVVPWVNGYTDLSACLTALGCQKDVDNEIIVVDRLGEELREKAQKEFPKVLFFGMASDATIPEMRAFAFLQAKAPAMMWP